MLARPSSTYVSVGSPLSWTLLIVEESFKHFRFHYRLANSKLLSYQRQKISRNLYLVSIRRSQSPPKLSCDVDSNARRKLCIAVIQEHGERRPLLACPFWPCRSALGHRPTPRLIRIKLLTQSRPLHRLNTSLSSLVKIVASIIFSPLMSQKT